MDAPPRADRQERTAAYRSEQVLRAEDLRARLQQLSVRQQRFEKFLAEDLHVDHPGLETMQHLISSGSTTPSELARKIGLSTAAMSLVLNRLEAAGHITRERHPSDRRKLVVTAAQMSTDQAYERVLPMIEGVEALVASLSPDERNTIESFLDRLLAIYDDATQRPMRP
jgi:DNA-binding MarR family transcriptional regulator